MIRRVTSVWHPALAVCREREPSAPLPVFVVTTWDDKDDWAHGVASTAGAVAPGPLPAAASRRLERPGRQHRRQRLGHRVLICKAVCSASCQVRGRGRGHAQGRPQTTVLPRRGGMDRNYPRLAVCGATDNCTARGIEQECLGCCTAMDLPRVRQLVVAPYNCQAQIVPVHCPVPCLHPVSHPTLTLTRCPPLDAPPERRQV